jgi:hypothetical protein
MPAVQDIAHPFLEFAILEWFEEAFQRVAQVFMGMAK